MKHIKKYNHEIFILKDRRGNPFGDKFVDKNGGRKTDSRFYNSSLGLNSNGTQLPKMI